MRPKGCQSYASKRFKTLVRGEKWRVRGEGEGPNIFPQGNFPSLILLGANQVAAIEEEGADEGVEIAIEDFLDIAALDLGAVVFYELIGLEGVGADLAAEADFGLGGVELAEIFAALIELELIELRFENFHGDFAIFVLAALVL